MPSVDIAHARTSKTDPADAAEDLLTQIGAVKPKLVTVFGSRERDHRALNRAIMERLPKGTRLLGTTTGGEIDRDGMHSGTVVLGALSGDIEFAVAAGKGLSTDAPGAGETAIRLAAQQLGARADDLTSRKFGALVMDDAMKFKKEEMLLGVMSMNQGLVAVGGGASDHETDPMKQSALIHVDGEVMDDAVAVALFRTDAPWAAMRSHWYSPTGQMIRITKIDPSSRVALEIDGQPAAKRYAELLGVTPEDLDFGKPRGFAVMPTALRVGREYFIRSPWKALPDGSILFANMLEAGTELELVRLGDIGESTRRFLESDIPARVQNPRAALFFECGGRRFFAEASGKGDVLSKAFRSAPPCAGFNCAFEIYCGFHINTTLTAAVFGASA